MQKKSKASSLWYDIKKRIGKVGKLIVTDLDGTLLDSHSNLKEEYVNEIERLIKDVAQLTVASGRTYDSIRTFAERLGIKMPIICELGAVIVDPLTNKKIFEKSIPAKVVRKTLNLLKDGGYLFNVYLCKESNYTCFKSSESPFFLGRKVVWEMDDDLMNILNVIFKNINDYKEFTFRGIRKISIRFEEAQFNKLKKALEEVLGQDATVSRSDVNCIDVSPAGVSKGVALRYILEMCEIDPKNVMAIGDNETDSTMFDVVGYPVAVENADETTKKSARFITSSNEEKGVIYAIKKFLEA